MWENNKGRSPLLQVKSELIHFFVATVNCAEIRSSKITMSVLTISTWEHCLPPVSQGKLFQVVISWQLSNSENLWAKEGPMQGFYIFSVYKMLTYLCFSLPPPLLFNWICCRCIGPRLEDCIGFMDRYRLSTSSSCYTSCVARVGKSACVCAWPLVNGEWYFLFYNCLQVYRSF